MDDPSVGLRLTDSLSQDRWPDSWRQWMSADVEIHQRAGLSVAEISQRIYPLTSTDDDELVRAWALHPSLCGIPNGVAAFFRTSASTFDRSATDMADWALSSDSRALLDAAPWASELRAAVRQAVRHAVPFRLVGYHAYEASMGLLTRWAQDHLRRAGRRFAIDVLHLPSNRASYLSPLLAARWPMASIDAETFAVVNFFAHGALAPLLRPAPRRLTVLWAWELEEIPPLAVSVARDFAIDTVFALSPWSADAFRVALPCRVEILALTNPTYLVESPSRSGSSRGPYVLSILDARSRLGRKNPEAVLRVWAAVADEFPDHSLVLKTMALADEGTDELMDLIARSPRTTLIDDHLSDEEYRDLVANAAAYVTLPRSEGLGLTPLEAAVHGVPVVYSDYSGLHDNFDGAFFPVPVTMVRVGDSGYDNTPYPDDAWWGDPDVDVAATQLRRALVMSREDALVEAATIREHLQHEDAVAGETLSSLSDVELSARWMQLSDQLGRRTWRFKLVRRAARLLAPLRPVVAAVFRVLPESLRRRLRATRT